MLWAGPADADFNSGDIAVLEADPTILQPGEAFDLTGEAATFTPKAGGGYTLAIAAGSINPSLGTNLALPDDGSSGALPLGFTFPFFGTNYTAVFVNSNGFATFGAASSFVNFNSAGATDLSTVLDRMASGFPRIAALWNDLDPSAGGGVFFNALADRALITWNNVPRFGATGTSNTVQITLFPGGAIQLTYGSVSAPSTAPVFGGFLVGISPGEVHEFVVTTVDFHTGIGGSISTSPNSEPLVQVFGSMPNPLVHVLAVARRLYQTHADIFDQIVMFANFDNALDGAFAFEITSRISMGGTGQGIFNDSSFYGSAGRLHSVLNMNKLSLYPADPTTKFLRTNSTLDVMGQEAGHQWLAFLHFSDGGISSDLLLGRQLAHWSFFFDSDASDMEGNNWVDNANGTFTSNDATNRYNSLDQYAMGLRSAGEVPDFFFIKNPTGTTRTRSSSPEIGVTVSGTRQNVSISQITAIEGTRPAGFSGVNPTTIWHQAFVLVVKAGITPPTADLSKIDTIRSQWVSYFGTAVGGRGSIATALGPVWSEVPGGGLTPSSPAAVLEGTTLHLVVRGVDDRLYLNSRSGGTFGGWSEVPGGGLTLNQPAAVLDSSGALRLFVEGLDTRLYVNTPGTTWSGWSEVPGGGQTLSGPTAALDAAQVRLEVRGMDNRIYTTLVSAPPYTEVPGGGLTASSPAAVLEGSTLHLFVRGADNRLYLNSRIGGTFTGWSEVPGGGLTLNQPAAVLDSSGALRLYVQGINDRLYVNTRTGATWSGWSEVPVGGLTRSGPAAVLDGGSVRLVVRGIDDRIYTSTP